MNKIYIYLASYREPMYNIKRNQKGGAVNMEEKIWELFLVLFGVLLTTAIDIAREGYKENHRRHRIKRKS